MALTQNMVPVVNTGGSAPTLDTVNSVITMKNGNVGIGATSLTITPTTNGGVGNIAAAITALGSPASGYVLTLMPGTYIENSLTFPNVPVIINGNGAEIVTAYGAGTGTVTFLGLMIMEGVVLIGNVVQSFTSPTVVNEFISCTILGNVTIYGVSAAVGSTFMGNGTTNGVLTIGAGAFLDWAGGIIGQAATGYYYRLVNSGTLIMSNFEIFTNDNVNYIIDSHTAGSTIYIDFFRVYNFGTGGGISVNNNSSSIIASNDISNCYIYLAGTTNGIVCGTAFTTLANYSLVYSFNSTPTVGYAVGSGMSGRSFGNIFVSGLSYITSGVITNSGASLLLTAANMASNSIFQQTGSTAATFTLDTGTALSTEVSNVVAGTVVNFSVTNSSTATITMAGGVGTSLANAMTIATLQSRDFRALNTGTNTWVIY